MLCWCGLALARWEASGKVGTLSVLLYLGVQAVDPWSCVVWACSLGSVRQGRDPECTLLLYLGVQAVAPSSHGGLEDRMLVVRSRR